MLDICAKALRKGREGTLRISNERGYIFWTPSTRMRPLSLKPTSVVRITLGHISGRKPIFMPLCASQGLRLDVGIASYTFVFTPTESEDRKTQRKAILNAIRAIYMTNRAVAAANLRARGPQGLKTELLTLPAELRNMIYEQLALAIDLIDVVRIGQTDSYKLKAPVTLQEVCTQTRREWAPHYRSIIYLRAAVRARVTNLDFTYVNNFLQDQLLSDDFKTTAKGNKSGLPEITIKLHFTRPVSARSVLAECLPFRGWVEAISKRLPAGNIEPWPRTPSAMAYAKYFVLYEFPPANVIRFTDDWLGLSDGHQTMRDLYNIEPEMATILLSLRRLFRTEAEALKAAERKALAERKIREAEEAAQAFALTSDGRQPKRRRVTDRGDYVLLNGWEEHDEWRDEQKKLEPFCEEFANLTISYRKR